MKAKLVYVSLATRVVVPDNATEEEILAKAKPQFIEKVQTELGEHLEEIEDDLEIPYGDCPFDKENIIMEGDMTDPPEKENLNEGKDICSKCGAVQEYGTMKDLSDGSFDLRCEKCRPFIEQECEVDVEFTDLNGKKRTGTICHNGEEDCWYGIDFIDQGEDIAFDFNTFDRRVYGDETNPDKFFGINAYQCMKKHDGAWCMDEAIEIPCRIVNISLG